MKGRVSIYYATRGFGFITINFRERIFFHFSKWTGSSDVGPIIGQEVIFDTAPGRTPVDGPQAVNVRPIEQLTTAATDILAGAGQGEAVKQ